MNTIAPSRLPMQLKVAAGYAAQIVHWLDLYLARATIAGSIRRSRPMCGDVDIVCIPKLVEAKTGFFAEDKQVENTLLTYLKEYVRRGGNDPKSPVKPQWLARQGDPGPEPQWDAQNLLLELPKCQLDLWCANEENFATRLMCRTGSAQHNIWLASRAKALDLHWNPYKGIFFAGKSVPLSTPTEEAIYAALKLPFIEPRNRELGFLIKQFGPAENV
jgi:DNA polymerase/3'-5' exonuclease PolX